MREETVNRRITKSIDEIPLKPLREYLKDRLRFERSKMDKDQPYFKKGYKKAGEKYAPSDPQDWAEYDVGSLIAEATSKPVPEKERTESEPIQIFEIRLRNWRQYGGEVSISLEADDNKLINVIEGENGSGKTNILNALTLCFYGTEMQEQSDDENLEQLPYVTRSQLEDEVPGETVEGYVEVEIGVDQPEYIFRREFETTVEEDGGFADSIGDLELRQKSNREWVRKDNPATALNRVLPAKVNDYFLFDGEDLDGFFDEEYASRVEDAILDVSHLELINRAIYHLGEIREDLEDDASDVDGTTANLRDEMNNIEETIGKKRDRLAKVEEDIEETQQNIEEINNKLLDLNDDYVKRLHERRDEIKEDFKDLEGRKNEIQQDTKSIITAIGPVINAADALLEAHDNFEELSGTENIPPKIQRRFINELIERGECICGRPVEEKSKHIEHLEVLRQSVFDVSEEQVSDASRIPAVFESVADQVERLIEKRREIAHIEDELSEKNEKLQELNNELKSHRIPDDTNISALESNREELEEGLERLRNKRARVNVEIEELEEEYEELQTELRAELAKQEEQKELRAHLELVTLAEHCLDEIKQSILEELRSRTEANLEQYYNKLIWKDEKYNIKLSDDYSISVAGKYENNKIGSLSAGETQVLALSFMAALTQISGFDAPVVIDTPLGRISSTPKRLIAENLPNYMSNTQITFLMTDEEYTGEVQDSMQHKVSNEYLLVHENNETRVVRRDEAQEVNLND